MLTYLAGILSDVLAQTLGLVQTGLLQLVRADRDGLIDVLQLPVVSEGTTEVVGVDLEACHSPQQ